MPDVAHQLTPEQCEALIGHCWEEEKPPAGAMGTWRPSKRLCRHCGTWQKRTDTWNTAGRVE